MWKFSNKRTENNINIIIKEFELRDKSMLDKIDERFKEQRRDFQKLYDDLLKALNNHTEDINKNRVSIAKLEASIDYIKEQINK